MGAMPLNVIGPLLRYIKAKRDKRIYCGCSYLLNWLLKSTRWNISFNYWRRGTS